MSPFESQVLAELRRIGSALERVADALNGSGDEDDPPGVAESLMVLTSAVLDEFGVPEMPLEGEQPEKPS